MGVEAHKRGSLTDRWREVVLEVAAQNNIPLDDEVDMARVNKAIIGWVHNQVAINHRNLAVVNPDREARHFLRERQPVQITPIIVKLE